MMNTSRLVLTWATGLAVAGLALILAACGTARRQVPEVGRVNWAEASVNPGNARRGQVLFYNNCHRCHPSGEGGLGQTLNNKPLPDAVIRYQIRHGLGAMPAFPESVLSKPDMEAIVAYLKLLRRQPPADQQTR